MKVQNIKDVNKFFEVVDNCAGKVELVTGEGDRLNLKSSFVSMCLLQIFSPTVRFRNWRSSLMRKRILISCYPL